jgi:hypothetical protein
MQTAQISNQETEEPRSSTDILKRAIAMALEVEQILRRYHGLEEREGFRLRLARAHSLSVVDALTEVVCRKPALVPVPALQSGIYSVRDDNPSS